MAFFKLFIITIINLGIIIMLNALLILSFIDWDFNIIHNSRDINSENLDSDIIIIIHNSMDINSENLASDIIIIIHNSMDINSENLDSDIGIIIIIHNFKKLASTITVTIDN